MSVYIYTLKYIHIYAVYFFLFTDILKRNFCLFNLKNFISNIAFLTKFNHKYRQKNPKHIFKSITEKVLLPFQVDHHP